MLLLNFAFLLLGRNIEVSSRHIDKKILVDVGTVRDMLFDAEWRVHCREGILY